MNDTYVEVMVKRRTSPFLGPGRILSYALAIAFLLIAILGNFVFFLGALIFAGIAYFVIPRFDIEYEYLYIDKEISIDKIMSQEKRKHVYTIDLNRMQIRAPPASHELDSYRARGLKSYDFTSGEADAKKYTIVYEGASEGTVLVDIEPNGEMLRAIKDVFPRKVLEF